MLDLEFLILLLLCWLPPIILTPVLIWINNKVTLRDLYLCRIASRRRWHSVRLFECAAVSRQTTKLRLGIAAVHTLAIFLLYELDILIVLPEVIYLERWGILQFFIFILYLIPIIGALSYDQKQRGFFWHF